MFEHLKNLEIRDKTSWCRMPQIAAGAELELRPSGLENAFYTSAVLTLAASKPPSKSATAQGGTTVVDLAESRAHVRVLFPKYVVADWRGVVDANGVEVKFSIPECADLFRHLPDWLIDIIIVHARNEANFLAAGEALPDPVALAPNLQSGSSGS